jgi:hypothetical protein
MTTLLSDLENRSKQQFALEAKSREALDSKFSDLFSELRKEFAELKDNTRPPSFASSSYASSTSTGTKRSRVAPSDSVSQAGPNKSTHRPEQLIMLGFSLDLLKSDMHELAKSILVPVLPSSVSVDDLEFDAFGNGNRCRINCSSADQARLIVENCRDKNLVWSIPEDNINDPIRVKFSEPFDIRMQAQFCYIVYQKLSNIASATSLPMPISPFVTSKKLGKISLRVSKGLSEVAKFNWDDCEKQIKVTFRNAAKYPQWINSDQLRSVIDLSLTEMAARG